MNSTENIATKEAFEYLVEIGKELGNRNCETYTKDIDGKTYLFDEYGNHEVIAESEPKAPETFIAYTLNGLVDWIRADVDNFFKGTEKCIVRVASPTMVEVLTPCKGKHSIRQKLAVCEYQSPRIQYGMYMDNETFGIMIQTCFEGDDNRDLVLKIVRNLTEEQSLQTADDGVSQRVTIKQGVQAVDSKVFKNPAFLRPQRTFTEIYQPDSPFVVRFKGGCQAALFESDGGKWRIEAVMAIGRYLSEKLSENNVIVIA